MTAKIETNELQSKLNKATQERDTYVEDANKQVAFLNGRIAMLEELINPTPEAEAQEAQAPETVEKGA